MDFTNKVIVVTGATGPVGSAIVNSFLRHGAIVAAVARTSSQVDSTNAPHDRLIKFSADVTDETNVSSLFDTIQKDLGGVDILVHTVGGFWGGKNIQDTSLLDWERMMTVNLRSAFLCSKYALHHMEKKDGGKIITISAMTALEAKTKRGAYLTAKAGVIALTQAIAEEGTAINVQANSIAPGIILTEANKRDMPDVDSSKWIKPKDIAATILHLCSDKAKPITGNTIKML